MIHSGAVEPVSATAWNVRIPNFRIFGSNRRINCDPLSIFLVISRILGLLIGKLSGSMAVLMSALSGELRQNWSGW